MRWSVRQRQPADAHPRAVEDPVGIPQGPDEALQATDPDGNGNPDTLAQTIKFSYKFVFKNITVSNIASAIRLLNYMRKAKQGFDLYVSEDGVNFQTITVDGFGDPTTMVCGPSPPPIRACAWHCQSLLRHAGVDQAQGQLTPALPG